MASILDNDPVFFRLRGPVLPTGEEAPRMLGRIVRNFAQPLGSGYCPEDPTGFHVGLPTETKWLKANSVFKKSDTGSIELQLSGVGGGKAELDGEQSFSLKNSEVLAMELRHQPEVYGRLLSDKTIGEWIKTNCKINKPLFMVTGLLVWRDAIQSESSTQKRGLEISGKAPIGSAAAAAATSGATLPLPSIGDLSLSGKKATSHTKEQERESEDSQVFAVEYKIIRKRKRDVLGWSAPVFRDRGPAVDADRTYGDDSTGKSDDPGVDDEGLPELEMDLPWNEVVEDLEEQPEIETEAVETESSEVQFISVA